MEMRASFCRVDWRINMLCICVCSDVPILQNMQKTIGLRSSDADQIAGLDIPEMGVHGYVD